MGYITRDLAEIKDPKILSLSGQPNFVQIAGKQGVQSHTDMAITVKINRNNLQHATLTITDYSGMEHRFEGTINQKRTDSTTFYVSDNTTETAENIRQAFLQDNWLASHFHITICAVEKNGKIENGNTIRITSKGTGSDYRIQISASAQGFGITTFGHSLNNDSLSGEETTAEIALDIYADPGIRMGGDDAPTDIKRMGNHIAILRKTYAGVPVWFNLNALFSQYSDYHRPPDTPGWFNPGTLKSYRFVASKTDYNTIPFYYSNALFILQGHGPLTEEIDLEEYIYRLNPVKLLTNRPSLPYVRGQKEFLNFLFIEQGELDPATQSALPYSLKIAYQAYTGSGNYLGVIYGQEKASTEFLDINSCLLDMETVLNRFPKVGMIRVALTRGVKIISNFLEYQVMPEDHYTVRQFIFLNRLGGWDSYNFNAGIKKELKHSSELYHKALTPAFRKGDSIETVYQSSLDQTYTIEGAPVSDETAEWLKELATSRVVFDGEGRYVIIEDFKLTITPENRNMQRPIIKYRLSENVSHD